MVVLEVFEGFVRFGWVRGILVFFFEGVKFGGWCGFMDLYRVYVGRDWEKY